MAGPGTVVCDYMSYVFMFLSIATSNMVATSLARQVSLLSDWKVLLFFCVIIDVILVVDF